MISVNKESILTFKNKKYKCSIGINGITDSKVEGDGCTPSGKYGFGSLFYRADRIKKINTKIKLIPIVNDMYWSDYSNSIYYNKLLKFKDKSFEYLYRKDHIYDIVLVINYNTNPIIKNKGSAIFLHIAKKNFTPTKGCIALKKKDFLEILKDLDPKNKINILNS